MDNQNYNIQKLNEDEISILDLLLPIFEHKIFILKITFYSFIISAIISLFLPKIYKSSAKILPPQTQASVSQQILSQISGLAVSGLPSLSAIKDTSALYQELLRSNEVLDYVIKNNNLFDFYKEKDKNNLREILKSNLIIETDKKSGIMTISYLSKKPEVSYRVVVSFIDGLKKLNNKLAITEASQRRLFYEEQLRNAKENLILSEEDLKKFQQKTGSIKIDEEAKAAIEEASILRAKISAKEVQLKVLKSYTTSENPEYKNTLDEISALKEQLAKLQSKIPSEDDSLFSTRKVSVYGMEYIRKMREFKYNESLYEILLKQYEVAKLDESRDSTVIQIIEEPEIPREKFKPKRKEIVLKWSFIAFFFSIFWIYIKIFFKNLNNIASSEKIKLVKEIKFYDFKKAVLSDVLEFKKMILKLLK